MVVKKAQKNRNTMLNIVKRDKRMENMFTTMSHVFLIVHEASMKHTCSFFSDLEVADGSNVGTEVPARQTRLASGLEEPKSLLDGQGATRHGPTV